MSGRARGLSPKTLDWYAMIGERFAAFRMSSGADPALGAMSVAEARAFVVSLQDAGLRSPPNPGESDAHPGESQILIPKTERVSCPVWASQSYRARGADSIAVSIAGRSRIAGKAPRSGSGSSL